MQNSLVVLMVLCRAAGGKEYKFGGNIGVNPRSQPINGSNNDLVQLGMIIEIWIGGCDGVDVMARLAQSYIGYRIGFAESKMLTGELDEGRLAEKY